MPFYRCDSSGLVKRHVDEIGSAWVRAIVDPASANIVSIADITRAEVTSAFARRTREGVITLNFSSAIRCELTTRCSWLPPVSSINNQSLIAHGLPPLVFVTADDRLIAATRGEAVTAENPNLHP